MVSKYSEFFWKIHDTGKWKQTLVMIRCHGHQRIGIFNFKKYISLLCWAPLANFFEYVIFELYIQKYIVSFLLNIFTQSLFQVSKNIVPKILSEYLSDYIVSEAGLPA